jgi:hypothetical protein
MREVAGWGLIILAAASLACALYGQYQALTNLAGDQEITRRAVLRRGPFASRRFFTDTGWRHWIRSYQFGALTAVLLIIGSMMLAR